MLVILRISRSGLGMSFAERKELEKLHPDHTIHVTEIERPRAMTPYDLDQLVNTNTGYGYPVLVIFEGFSDYELRVFGLILAASNRSFGKVIYDSHMHFSGLEIGHFELRFERQ